MKNLSIVVPYRNREEHLGKFIPSMESYLSNKEFTYRIFIVEQGDDKPFNRGKLLNVGFAESKESDYFCFHDVDMIPINADYSHVGSPTHMATEAEQFGWKLPYEGYFGGVTMFDRDSFTKINGYANEYWGWGAEDDDILARCQIMGLETYRRPGKFQSLSHDRNIDQSLYNQNLTKLNLLLNKPTEKRVMLDGLTNLTYTKVKEEAISEKAVKITVSI
jgi:predicted glycosyltransferase involved in capsule biosynthesis